MKIFSCDLKKVLHKIKNIKLDEKMAKAALLETKTILSN
jgi:hypothetical protein